MREIKTGTIYRHFKGNTYKVLCIAKDTETLKDTVVYQDVTDNSKIWVRSLDMFSDSLCRDGKTILRFEEVD